MLRVVDQDAVTGQGLVRLISIQVLARALGCCVRTIRRRVEIEPGFPRPVMSGGRVMFVESEVRVYQDRLLSTRGR